MNLDTISKPESPPIHQETDDRALTCGDDISCPPTQTCPFSSRRAFYDWVKPITIRFTKFGFVGASGMFIDLGAYSLFMAVMPLQFARGFAIAVAMTWNFIWNRKVTFSDARRHSWFRQYLGYCASCLVGAAVNWWVSLTVGGLHPWLKDHPLYAAVLGVIAGMVFNFAFCLLLVFRPHKPDNTRV
ncbi:MAG: GtrA family protein [Planctomycetaceae bacterium]